MAPLVNQSTSTFSRFQEPVFDENRPRMLKDFLEDEYCLDSSCTSSTSSNALTVSNKYSSAMLLRSRSRRAAETTISALHKAINVVKLFHFTSSKSPTFLPGSFSRKLVSKSGKDKNINVSQDVSDQVKAVKVKDILRWRSFRNLVEERSAPLDFPGSPIRSMTTTTTTTTATTSKRSSWCESDFTDEELPLWCGENEGFSSKKCSLGQPAGTPATTLRNLKGEWLCEEYEQQSPVSVLDSPFRDVGECYSPVHPILANIQRARCILERRIQQSDGLTKPKHGKKHTPKGQNAVLEGANATEAKAKQLLSNIKESNLGENIDCQADDRLMFDFFVHELSTNGKPHDVKFDSEVLRIVKAWLSGEQKDDESYEWEVEGKREAYVKDMEKGVCWNKFQQEQEEMSTGLEMMMLNELIDEVLGDLLNI